MLTAAAATVGRGDSRGQAQEGQEKLGPSRVGDSGAWIRVRMARAGEVSRGLDGEGPPSGVYVGGSLLHEGSRRR